MPRLTVLDLRGDRSDPRDRLPRPRVDLAEAREGVDATLAAVRDRGDDALRELTSRFDGHDLVELVVPDEVLDAALEDLEPELRSALERATDQVRWFHERAKPQDWEDVRDGARMGVWHRPVQRAGVYVPGGKAVYPSTVIMTVVPAQVAGVDELVLCTPPTGLDADGRPDGWPNRTILAAARLLGVDRVVRVGGAQAIAAMAYGTASVPPCDMVVGPGNLYVSLAKQRLAAEGMIGTDGYAGPTEVAVVADGTADPLVVAADLVAQAEHDELATALLITPDADLSAAVEAALADEVARAAHRERVEAALAGQGTVVLVDDLDHAVEVAEAFAAEHLEVHTADARKVAERIRYAGTTFVGAATPVSLGDYAAGPNHTLPTSGTARFAGGLTTSSFLVPVNFVEYDDASLRELAASVRTLAHSEDLPAHWRAVEVRVQGVEGRPEGIEARPEGVEGRPEGDA
jgi:histidinol dehydrogenase